MNKEFDKWLEGRPEIIKTIAKKVPPWFLYKLKTTGQHCHLYSYSEDGTVTIDVCGHESEELDGWYQLTPMQVFGINPDDLEKIGRLEVE